MKWKYGNNNGMKLFKRRDKHLQSFFEQLQDEFREEQPGKEIKDPYGEHAWVHIAISLLIRNIGRATFKIYKNGEEDKSPISRLFRDVNPYMNRYDLWKETAAWWYLEGEAFWFFGKEYRAGIPEQIHVINPRKIKLSQKNGQIHRWYFHTTEEVIPLMPSEVIHFRNWNPWNAFRGVNPLIALREELTQDLNANRANTELLKNDAIPRGLIKTDQVLRPDEAEMIERKWEEKYGLQSYKKKIAVLGKGTEFQSISFNPDIVKFFDLKRWNLYTILALYGIPPRVANIQDNHSNLSGTDTSEQHAAFWKYTIIPLLKNFEQVLETQFFARFKLKLEGSFDLRDIPELQESEGLRSKRDIEEINAGIKTINEVLVERGKEEKSWGDRWYHHKNLVFEKK